MRRVNAITIDGDLDTIYQLGAQVERWPALLQHYRSVDVLWQSDDGQDLVARMAASRDGIPVAWMCRLRRDPTEPRITFRHIGGFTRGMQVAWTFERGAAEHDPVTVRITHEFRKGWPVIDRFVSETVVGEFFVAAIAGKTLAMVKLLAEAERAAGPDAATREAAGA